MKIIIITGQTATGKTNLALEYAQKYNGELINFDARQVYKHLNIITGKDKYLFKSIKMNLIDVIKPDEYFSSFDFVNLALPIINELLQQNKTLILVGGTYMYIKHLLYGIETQNIPPDFKLRKKLAEKSVTYLQKRLLKLNPKLFNSLNKSEQNNPQRLIRKIEISMNVSINRLIDTFVNKDVSSLKFNLPQKLGNKKIRIEFIGLKFKDQENLRQAIKKRVEVRIKMGAIHEVKKILKMGYHPTDPGLKTIGYQQLILHLSGVVDLPEALEIWINKEVQYAKRQYTFMKTDSNIKWKEI